MLTPDERKLTASTTRITQIIIFALLAGTASFFAVVVLMKHDPPQPDQKLAYMAAASAVAGIIAALVVGSLIISQKRVELAALPQDGSSDAPTTRDATKLLEGFQIRRIIQGALLEGSAFFNLVVYQQQQKTYSLAIAATLMVGLALLFPLRPLVENWLDCELRKVRDLRNLRDPRR